MTKYYRLTVNIESAQQTSLAALSKETGLSASALTRLALQRFLREPAIFLPSSLSKSKRSDERELEGAVV